jgi:reverse transcriptase-like protein
MSEPGGDPSPGISSGDALIRPERHPACRRREARPGFRMERENLCFVTPPGVKGQAASGSNREGESTEAGRRGGAARSSVEGHVMGLGLRCSALVTGQLETGGARGRGKAVQDPQAGSLGGFQACEGQPRSGWCGWTVGCGVRGQPIGQLLQALEPAVVRELLSSACRAAQGGISPLLANLFLHYAFDAWMARNFAHILFARYADDIICHCKSAEEARALWSAIADRLTILLAMNPAIRPSTSHAMIPISSLMNCHDDSHHKLTPTYLERLRSP